MKSFVTVVLILIGVLALSSCGSASSEPQAESMNASSDIDDFSNAVPIAIGENILQNCIAYAARLGYETGTLKKSVLLGEAWVKSVSCDDERKLEMLDAADVVVVFDNIRCVVDADTEIVLGRIPYM